jgi:hypothetical protein
LPQAAVGVPEAQPGSPPATSKSNLPQHLYWAIPHLYIGPYFEFTTTVNRAVRAELAHPTLFFVGLVTGVEF